MFHKRTLLVYVDQTERGGRGSILGWGCKAGICCLEYCRSANDLAQHNVVTKQSNKAVVHDWVVCGLHVLQIERLGIRVPAGPSPCAGVQLDKEVKDIGRKGARIKVGSARLRWLRNAGMFDNSFSQICPSKHFKILVRIDLNYKLQVLYSPIESVSARSSVG